MNRISIIRSLALASTVALFSFATTGCFAEPSPSQNVAEQQDDIASNGKAAADMRDDARTTKAVVGAVETHPTGTTVGPQPDPWVGDEGPQPDPWVPHAHLSPPGDPDPSNPSTNTGAGGNNSNTK